MWRFIVLIACALVVGDATGLIDDCDETCLDDSDGKQCPPACDSCSCPGHALRVAAPLAQVVTNVELAEQLVVDAPPPTIEHGLLDPAPALRPPIA